MPADGIGAGAPNGGAISALGGIACSTTTFVVFLGNSPFPRMTVWEHALRKENLP